MKHFVFCHGFGFDTQFWEHIEPYFSREKCSFIDLGYFNNQLDNQCFYNQRIIGIGHSIGLAKLVSMYSNFDCLIGLNSFISFLGYNNILRRKRYIELKAMRSRFLKDPESTLRDFYMRCGTPELIKYRNFSNLNFDLILSDFQLLENEYELPQVPTLILNSQDDIIIPPILTSDNFSTQPRIKVDNITSSNHALGFKKPEEVYYKIMSFLNDKAF